MGTRGGETQDTERQSLTATIRKRYTDAGQPCRIPLSKINLCVVPCPNFTELFPPAYNVFIALQKKGPNPKRSKQKKMKGCSIVSKALKKSKNRI